MVLIMKLYIPILAIILVAALLTGCITVVAAEGWPNAYDTKTIADELFTIIDLSEPSLSHVADLYKGGKFAEALDAYRNYFVDKVRGIEFDKFGWHSTYISPPYLDNASIWAGIMSVEEYKNKYPGRDILPEYYLNISGDPEQPVKTNWLGTDTKGNIPDVMWLRWFTNFNGAYWNTGEEVYIKKYFQLINDLALNFRNQALSAGLATTDFRAWNKNNNFIFSAMTRSNFILRQIVCFAKLLPDDGEKPVWDNVMNIRGYKVKADAYRLISSEALANTIINLVKEINPYFLNQYIKPGATPNQRLGGLEVLMLETLMFSESIQIKNQLIPALNEGFDSYLKGSLHADGANIEQAFNYNLGDLDRLKSFVKMFEGVKNPPAYAQLLKFRTEYADRLFKAIKGPLGGVPAVGMGGISQGVPTWKEDEAEKLIKSGKIDTVPFKNFNSVAFPYAGYYVLRNGWAPNDTYLFTQGPRRSKGHLYPSNGSIELQAYGRQLLMAGGAPWYFKTQVPNELLPEMGKFNSYFGDGSSTFNRNTVLVNGLSQDVTEKDGSILQDLTGLDPIPALWHTGDSFDMTQTFWTGGYKQAGSNTKTITDVEHRRDIIYLKDSNLFVVTDFLNAKKAGLKYSQVWNFVPYMSKASGDDLDVFGYKNEQVIADKDKATISTNDPDGPNVFLHNFINQPLEYVKYYGYKSEQGYRGWYSPGIEGMRYPKPDVHVNWSKAANDAPLLTLIGMSKDTKDPITDIKDLSDKAKSVSGFTAKAGDSEIVCQASFDAKDFSYNNIKAKASWFLVSNKNNVYSGIAIGCKTMTIGDQSIAIKDENFEFSFADGKLKMLPIKAPTGFAWTKKDEEPMPIYSKASAKDAINSAIALKQASANIYPVKAEIRRYMDKRVSTAVITINDSLKIMANCGGFNDAQKISDGINELASVIINYGLRSSTFKERERICNIAAELIKEIQKNKNTVDDIMIKDNMQKLSQEIALKASDLYKGLSSSEQLKKIIEDAIRE